LGGSLAEGAERFQSGLEGWGRGNGLFNLKPEDELDFALRFGGLRVAAKRGLIENSGLVIAMGC
jgi:hypothetical protein